MEHQPFKPDVAPVERELFLWIGERRIDYWLPTADIQQRNVTEGLKARLPPYRGKSFAAITDPAIFKACDGARWICPGPCGRFPLIE